MLEPGTEVKGGGYPHGMGCPVWGSDPEQGEESGQPSVGSQSPVTVN